MKRPYFYTIFISIALLVSGLILAGCGSPTPTPASDPVGTIVAQTMTAQPDDFNNVVGTIAAQTLAAQASPTSEVTSQPPVESTPTQDVPPAPTSQPTQAPTPTSQPTATTQPGPTPTVAPTLTGGDPRNTLGGASFTDKMDDSDYWPDDTDDYTAVEFEDGAMVLTARTGTDGWRLMTYEELDDFYIEIKGAFDGECSGTDHFGLIVRVPDIKAADRGYLFGISCDGKYSLVEWDGTVEPDGSWKSHIPWKSSDAIHTGSGESNRVGLMASGNRLAMYINGEKVAEFEDDSFKSGHFGIFIGSDETDDLAVRIDELSIWER